MPKKILIIDDDPAVVVHVIDQEATTSHLVHDKGGRHAEGGEDAFEREASDLGPTLGSAVSLDMLRDHLVQGLGPSGRRNQGDGDGQAR